MAYAEIHDDEKAVTAAAVLHRAVAWFAERGVGVERVLSDSGSAYKSYLWRDTCSEPGTGQNAQKGADCRRRAARLLHGSARGGRREASWH